jgi:predicted nicotinamide N-methyase
MLQPRGSVQNGVPLSTFHSPLSNLPDIPGGWTERIIALENRSLTLTLPADPDAFLDDPRVHAAHAKTGYMPYWGYLWPASLETAAAVLRHDWAAGLTALEIGAGTGLTGLAALARGLRVTFSDYDEQSVQLCLHNARQNGLDHGEGLVFDWRNPPARTFDVIFGCDVIYEKPNHAPILDLLQTMLAPKGEAWLADPGRHTADEFVALARHRFTVDPLPVPREPSPGRPAGTTTIWRLRRGGTRAPATRDLQS